MVRVSLKNVNQDAFCNMASGNSVFYFDGCDTGTGKSSFVCAVCVGLGGSTHVCGNDLMQLCMHHQCADVVAYPVAGSS